MDVQSALGYLNSSMQGQAMDPASALAHLQASEQSGILPKPSRVTQNFGTYNPGLETFSGGIARDTNYAADLGTPAALPPGEWNVVSTYSKAKPLGRPGDSSNSGYGNAVMVQNKQTGEKLHLIHLEHVNAAPGQTLKGGYAIGTTGSSGNSTGPNLGIEYYDSKGKLGNIRTSPYKQYLEQP